MAASAAAAIAHVSIAARPFTVLAHENQAEFDRSLAAFGAEHRPTTEHQKFLVQQLAVHRWLVDRARRLEARAFDHLAGASPDLSDTDARIVSRMFETNPKSLDIIQRYAAQAEKSYYRAWRELSKSKLEQNEANHEVGYKEEVRNSASERLIHRGVLAAQNEANPSVAFNPALANPYKAKPNGTKPSLRSQYPDNLALCL
jgi:hypothetical protein